MMPQKPDYPPCPRCRKPFTRRSQREGLFERCISLVHVYPFRCQLCACRFLALQWGASFVKYRPDRRAYVRLPVRYPVTFKGDVTGTGMIANLSIQGCGIETDVVPPQGAILQLTLHETNGLPTIEVEAAVVRSVVPRLRQVGVEFLRLQAGEQERLRRVVEAHWHGLSTYKDTTIGGRSSRKLPRQGDSFKGELSAVIRARYVDGGTLANASWGLEQERIGFGWVESALVALQ